MKWSTAQLKMPPWPSSLNPAARAAPLGTSPSWQPPAPPIQRPSTWAPAPRRRQAVLPPCLNLLPHSVSLTHWERRRVPSLRVQERASLKPAHPVHLQTRLEALSLISTAAKTQTTLWETMTMMRMILRMKIPAVAYQVRLNRPL